MIYSQFAPESKLSSKQIGFSQNSSPKHKPKYPSQHQFPTLPFTQNITTYSTTPQNHQYQLFKSFRSAFNDIQSNQVFQKLQDVRNLLAKKSHFQFKSIYNREERKSSKMVSQPQAITKQMEKKLTQSIWKEIKKNGDHIIGRSFHSHQVIDENLYIIGGQNQQNGKLNDIFKINSVGHISKIHHSLPIPLSRHGSVKFENKIYIFGGQSTSSENSSYLFCFDSKSEQFSNIKYTTKFKQYLKLDSFSICLYNEKIIIFHGYLNTLQKSRYNQYAFQYDFQTNEFMYMECENQPSPRVNAAYTQNDRYLYIFGGEYESNKLEDLWKYEFTTNNWVEIQKQNQQPWPNQRTGAKLVIYNKYLIMFGGYTKCFMENNDLWIFNLENHQWKKIVQIQTILKTIESYKKLTIFDKKGSTESHQIYRSQSILELRRQQQREIKKLKEKQDFLKIFELTEEDKDLIDFRKSHTNHLNDHFERGKSNNQPEPDFPETENKLLEELTMRPQPRDGHSLSILNNQLVLFGGDKNKESLNDLYMVNIDRIFL